MTIEVPLRFKNKVTLPITAVGWNKILDTIFIGFYVPFGQSAAILEAVRKDTPGREQGYAVVITLEGVYYVVSKNNQ